MTVLLVHDFTIVGEERVNHPPLQVGRQALLLPTAITLFPGELCGVAFIKRDAHSGPPRR